MQELIIFTHIPKTSGVSFLKGVVEQNIDREKVYEYRRLPQFISSASKGYDFVHGHVPYGAHLFTQRPVKYITFLRDPVDRAISFYYFVQQGGDKPETRHPLCDYAESVSLKEFYQNPKFHNHQTRFVAGFIADKFYSYLDYPIVRDRILQRAKHNLKENYQCFGLLEYREESLAVFKSRMGWDNSVEIPHQKKTFARKQISEVDADTLEAIKKGNDLDIQLYQYALDIFSDYQDCTAQNSKIVVQ